MSYCQQMSDVLLNKLSELTDTSSQFDPYLNKINNFSQNVDKSDINKLNNVLNTTSTLENEIRSYAGTCLDGIVDLSIADDISDVFDIVPSNLRLNLSPALNLISSIIDINDLYKSLRIGEVVDKINSLLGCLSFSDCNVSGQIITLFDVYTSRYKGFTGSGFDISEIGIGTPFESISGDVKDIGKQMEKIVKKSSTIVPNKYF